MKTLTVSKFGVSNFRAISKFTEIELKPVTLLIGEKDSGRSSLINAFTTFVDFKKEDQGLDIQPFYFDNKNCYMSFESVINKHSSVDSKIGYRFTLEEKSDTTSPKETLNISPEKYEVSILFGMDTGRIRLKEISVKKIIGSDLEFDLLHFRRDDTTHILKLNLVYIIETINARNSYFFSNLYESSADKLIGDFVSENIAKEIMELGCKEFIEERHFESGIYYPKSLLGVCRYFKYYLTDIFFKKYGEDIDSIQYKCANKIIESVYEYIKSKLNIITEAIDVKYFNCERIKSERTLLPLKYYNDEILKEKLIEYIENKNFDERGYKIMRFLIKDFGIADDFSIDGDFTSGYSIYITTNCEKINIADVDKSQQCIVSTLLMVIMNGSFNLCFKGEEQVKYYEPKYYPIIIENPESNLNDNHQRIFADITMYLSKVLKTQIIIETDSIIIIDRFKELGCGKMYYFSKDESEYNKSQVIKGFEEF